jgi:hypothetical protein
MINKIVILAALIFALASYGCSKNSTELKKQEVLVVVEERLSITLGLSLKQFKSDLEDEGYIVTIKKNISASTSPSQIRKILQKYYYDDENLSGAVLIGKIAAPLFNSKKDQGDPYWHDYLADFYYMDLDGIWEDSDGNGVLDIHKDTEFKLWNKVRKKLHLGDNRTPEIWVSRIRADMLVSLGDEISLLKNYFEKNHNYRTGKLNLPKKRAFVLSAGVDVLNSDWGAWPNKIYSDIDVDQFHRNLGYTLRKFLSSEEGYEWGIINSFSGPRIHHLGYFFNPLNPEWWKTKEGRELITKYSDTIADSNDITWQDIKSIEPKILFYHLLASEVGRHDYTDYLAGSYIFSGLGLVAVAGTQHSGSVGVPALYSGLASGKSIGEAWKDALVWLVKHSDDKITIVYFPNEKGISAAGESNYKAVLIGDGTLKLPKR